MKNPLNQYDTPAWAARELWGAHFSDLRAGHAVLEPACGIGRMLGAVPPDVEAVGIEIDPVRAHKAHTETGRVVITGDALRVPFERTFDAAFGNPPFTTDFQDALLERFAKEMRDGFRCGLINPAYFFQTPRRVMRWNRTWSIYTEMLPRTLFPGLECPLAFAIFTKDPVPTLRGLRLYAETEAIEQMPKHVQYELRNGRGIWRPVVFASLELLGGCASVSELYDVIGGKRPTASVWWREKVRQTLQRHDCFQPVPGRPGYWCLADRPNAVPAPSQMSFDAVA